MVIEKENALGKVDKEAFLYHLYVTKGQDYDKISEQLMKNSVPYLLDEEKVTILNVLYNKNELVRQEFNRRFGIKEPENLKLLMRVAEWAQPKWKKR